MHTHKHLLSHIFTYHIPMHMFIFSKKIHRFNFLVKWRTKKKFVLFSFSRQTIIFSQIHWRKLEITWIFRQARVLYQMPSAALAWSVYELFKYLLGERNAPPTSSRFSTKCCPHCWERFNAKNYLNLFCCFLFLNVYL